MREWKSTDLLINDEAVEGRDHAGNGGDDMVSLVELAHSPVTDLLALNHTNGTSAKWNSER